ncbi:MAG: ABC transporter permease [Candidatus Fermentibacteria bacterium]|nr:ABC transporter permease [Candidatus Fermentibacteria bacterium]
MFRDSFIIMRKEMRRMFTDKRLLFMLVVLPLVMLPLMYSFMGKANKTRMAEINSYSSRIAVCQGQGGGEVSDLFLESLSMLNAHIETSDMEQIDSLKQRVIDKDIELLIVMPGDMNGDILENTVLNFSIFYNSTGDYSNYAFDQVRSSFSSVNDAIVRLRILEMGMPEDMLKAYTINKFLAADEISDLAEEGSVMGKLIGVMMPFFIVIYLFANSMKVGLDSVAGEKERGTLAMLLVNQVSRLSIVLGKMISVMVAAIVGAVSSAIGLKIASRYLIDMVGDSGASISEYTMGSTAILQFSIIVIPLAILISSLVLVVSTFARNVKEGQGMIMPVYIAVMVMGVTTMQTGDVPPEWMRMAPVFNSLVVLKDIFMQNALWSNVVFSLVTSLVVSALLIFVTLRMFNDERVLFRI